PNCDRPPAGRRVREVLGDGIIECEPAVLHLQHDGHRRELLTDRARLKDCARSHRHFKLHVGITIALGGDELALADDANCDARHSFAMHFIAHKAIHLFHVGNCRLESDRGLDSEGRMTERKKRNDYYRWVPVHVPGSRANTGWMPTQRRPASSGSFSIS